MGIDTVLHGEWGQARKLSDDGDDAPLIRGDPPGPKGFVRGFVTCVVGKSSQCLIPGGEFVPNLMHLNFLKVIQPEPGALPDVHTTGFQMTPGTKNEICSRLMMPGWRCGGRASGAHWERA